MKDSTFLTRVVLENYKSIAGCGVNLGPLMFLVGRNGAGKSNFLDALRFVADSLEVSLAYAFKVRQSINDVRRRSERRPRSLGMRLEFRIPDAPGEEPYTSFHGYYAFRIGARPRGGYIVQREECYVQAATGAVAMFVVEEGKVTAFGVDRPLSSTPELVPEVSSDQLFLARASGTRPFRAVYHGLRRMGFYSINPAVIRRPQPPDPQEGRLLEADGRNLASVLARMEALDPTGKQRLEEYLSGVVAGIARVEAAQAGPEEVVEFHQRVGQNGTTRKFRAASMSDGTLRALGVLMGLMQPDTELAPSIRLVGIEEPELALHPAATGVLLDSLMAASDRRQVLVTSQSPDLLDNKDISTGSLLAVVAADGVTDIGQLDEVGRTILKEHLYTPGELLRQGLATPDPEAVRQAASPRLFGQGKG